MLGTPFLVRSSCCGGEQCNPKEGCSVAQVTAEWLLSQSSERRPYGLSRLCAGLWLQLPVYPVYCLDSGRVGLEGGMKEVVKMTCVRV